MPISYLKEKNQNVIIAKTTRIKNCVTSEYQTILIHNISNIFRNATYAPQASKISVENMILNFFFNKVQGHIFVKNYLNWTEFILDLYFQVKYLYMQFQLHIKIPKEVRALKLKISLFPLSN